jgi:hypothetical protein
MYLKIKNLEKKNLIFFSELKVRRLGMKTSGFRTVRILKICRTSGLDVMSSRALLQIVLLPPTWFKKSKFVLRFEIA